MAGLEEILRRGSEDEEARPLDRPTILAGWDWLMARLGLPPYLVTPPRFAIRTYEYYKSAQAPEPLLLNSFFLKDLSTARVLFSEGKATSNLCRYVGCEVPQVRRDLLRDHDALEEAVAPQVIPAARWPGPQRHPLVLLQQAAVNLAFRELRDTGILAVNGPPGTGKTTLLRDLVAGIVAARAEAMAGFDDPSSAFVHSGHKLKAGQAWLHLYRMDPLLKGFEMLVASSNNKAVENVTAELPAIGAIAGDADDLRYFNTLSDALLQRKSWGVIAAVLGNAANRGRFKRTFWWDDDVGLATYLAEAAGTPQFVGVTDPESGISETRPPLIVKEQSPPRSAEEALRRWWHARKTFCAILEKSRKALSELTRIRELARCLPSLEQEEAVATAALGAAQDQEARAGVAVAAARGRCAEAEHERANLERRLAEHDRTAPALLARIFRTQRAREWRASRIVLATAQGKARENHLAATANATTCEVRLRDSTAARQAAEQRCSVATARHAAARRDVAAARQRIGASLIDEGFFAREHGDKHQAVPWLTAAEQRVRDDVFVAAMALHKAFVDAAAKPIRHNLGVLMNRFGGRALPTAELRALMLDLWASLFLVVPVISTTFASVERMLGDLPPEALAWLFVDEAGQALPQAAVGALMRSRRAVIVGDPMQIQPVVALPDALTHAICTQFGVDPNRFNAPGASVQTLADAATPYSAEFQDKQGSRVVGVPLLVHRRCCEPMFGVANAIAYGRQMVNAKAPAPSPIGEVLGPSAWFDVKGGSMEKWCPEEGEMMLALFRRLAAARINPDLYVVTPFVVVADNLRKLARESGILDDWTADTWAWARERIGTVHTVQGREAEAVMFVLGAPAAHQTGARGWAGWPANLLNVAVTRAKERLYVIGNRGLWREAGVFRELDARLPQR